MNLEKLIKLVTSNLGNLNIKYSFINGKENLIVNGQEVLDEEFDDSKTLKQIEDYKQLITELDDDTWLEGIEEIEEIYDLNMINEIMKKDHFTESESEIILDSISTMKEIFKDIILNKIDNLTETLNKF